MRTLRSLRESTALSLTQPPRSPGAHGAGGCNRCIVTSRPFSVSTCPSRARVASSSVWLWPSPFSLPLESRGRRRGLDGRDRGQWRRECRRAAGSRAAEPAGPGRHRGGGGTGPLRACGLPLSLPCFDSILFRNGHWKRRRRVRILAERKGPQTPLLGRVR